MSNIPQQIIDFANSDKIYELVENLGEKFSFHIDQIGQLDADIRGVLLGYIQPSDFSEQISKDLEIKRDLADKVTEAVNESVFTRIKSWHYDTVTKSDAEITRPQINKISIRDVTDPTIREQHISALEKAGGFEIEREGHSPEADSWQKIEPMNVPETILEPDTGEKGETEVKEPGDVIEPETPANLPVEKDMEMNRDISSVPSMTSDTPKAPSVPITTPVNNNVEQKPTANAFEEQMVDTPKRNTAKPGVFEPMVISPQSTTITKPEILATNTPEAGPKLKENELPKDLPQKPAEIQRPDMSVPQVAQETIPAVPKPPVVSETPKKIPKPEVKNYDRDPYREPID